MIKLDYEVKQISTDGIIIKCEGELKGSRGALIHEIAAVLETFEEQAPIEFSKALDIFLSKRGC